jgi:hypothetical protein
VFVELVEFIGFIEAAARALQLTREGARLQNISSGMNQAIHGLTRSFQPFVYLPEPQRIAYIYRQ